jgi:transcription elongation factor GreA
MNKYPMTAAGYSVLENELKHRIHIERPRLIERLQEAIADDSNLAENPEYQAVKSEQEINEARIAELEDKLARADVIDVSKLSGDTIKFGATVSLIEKDTGEHKVWQIVGEPEADANKGNISVTSPIARALIGKTRGETVGGRNSTWRQGLSSSESRVAWRRPASMNYEHFKLAPWPLTRRCGRRR